MLDSHQEMSSEKPTVMISLTCRDSAAALDFYTRAFGAKELFRLPSPDGCLAHAEFMIGNSLIFMSDAAPEVSAHAMEKGSQSSCSFSIDVENCDEAFAQAKAAGAEVISEPTDQFYGVRDAQVKDPEGYRWYLGQKVEEVSAEEMAKRAQALFGG